MSGSSGGASRAREEEMEEEMEVEEGSSRTVAMPATRGTFIAGTADGTVTEARNSQKHQRAAVNVCEDLLNRQIQDYGLVTPERAKNLVWSYFKKYGSKNLTRGHSDMTISRCSSKPSARSVLGTRTDVFLDGSLEDTSSRATRCSGGSQ